MKYCNLIDACLLSNNEIIIVYSICEYYNISVIKYNIDLTNSNKQNSEIVHKLESKEAIKKIMLFENDSIDQTRIKYLVILNENGRVNIIVPDNMDENDKLTELKINITWKQICLLGSVSKNNENCIKVFKDGTIVAGYKKHIMIWTLLKTISNVKFNSEKIEGITSQICAIDRFNDGRIIALDVNGKIITFGINTFVL